MATDCAYSLDADVIEDAKVSFRSISRVARNIDHSDDNAIHHVGYAFDICGDGAQRALKLIPALWRYFCEHEGIDWR